MKTLNEIFDEASPLETEKLLKDIETDRPDELTEARIRRAVMSSAGLPAGKADAKRRGLGRTAKILLATAAAAVLTFAAVFAAVKLAGRPGQEITVHNTPHIGTDVTPAPTGIPGQSETPPPTDAPNSAFELSDAVCWVTIGSKLSQSDGLSYFRAKVNRTYKGTLPENIILCQDRRIEIDFGSVFSDQLLVFIKSMIDSGSTDYDDVYFVLDKSYAVFTPLTPVIPYGRGDAEIGIDGGSESEPLGPEDFFIDGDDIAVLDSLNKRIKVFGGEGLVRSIEVPGGYPTAMTKLGGSVFVLDYTLDNVYEIDWETGGTLRTIPLRDGSSADRVQQMTSDGQSVWLWSWHSGAGYDMYDLMTGETKRVLETRVVDKTVYWKTEFMDDEQAFREVFFDMLGCGEDGSAYFMVSDPVKGTGVMMFETTLQKFSPAGELVGIARLPSEDYVWIGHRSVFLGTEGRTYHIACEKEGMRVYLVELGTAFESRMDELYERAASLDVGSGDGEVYFRDPIFDDASNGPEDFAVIGNDLYILNSAAENVLRFNSEGGLLETIPFPVHMMQPIRFLVGSYGIYVIDLYGNMHVFDPYTYECRTVGLPLERGSVDPMDAFDSGEWFGGDGFAGSIMLMYERGDKLVFVVHESYRLISSYVYDPASGSIERTDEYGFSGTWTGVGNRYGAALHNNETGRDLSFSLGEWAFLKLLGEDDNGGLFVEAFRSTDYQPVPRKVFRIGPDGSVTGASAEIESSDFITFTLSDRGTVYAMIRENDKVSIMLMNML
ncbi:MAG: hypothetical protein J5586_00080 [Clostridia bacterium]|nr:hypothetical protein [Clostridia bacterium]